MVGAVVLVDPVHAVRTWHAVKGSLPAEEKVTPGVHAVHESVDTV